MTFKQDNLVRYSARALIVMAMHGKEGILETDFIESQNIPMAQWAIVRPWIYLFCHDNSSRLCFRQQKWCHDVKMNYDTSGIANIGYSMIEWWSKQHHRIKEAAAAIASIYLYIWHLPFEMGEDVEQMKQRVLAILLSPEVSAVLPSHYHSSLWSYFKNNPFSVTPTILIGKPSIELPVESQIAYYNRLIRTAESLNRTPDIAWCYRQLANIKNNATWAETMEAHALLVEGKATLAIKKLTGFLNRVTGSDEEILQKRFVRARAFLMKEDFDATLKETMLIFELMDNFVDSEEYCNAFQTLYMLLCHELAFKTTEGGLTQASNLISLVIEQDTLANVSIANPLHYDFYMTLVF